MNNSRFHPKAKRQFSTPSQIMWYVYMIQCSDNSLYTGITTDILRRIKEHNSGKGGSYTRTRQPVKLIHKETYSTRSQALKREYQIKCWSRDKKLALISGIKDFNNFQIIERRHFIRHPLSLPLAYKVIKSGLSKGLEDIRSETINVSAGGLLFPAKHPVEPNSMIAIKIPFEDKMFNIKAKVVRCVNNSETKFYDIAVSFFRLNEAFKAKMIEQIYLIAEYRDLLTLQSGKEVSLEEASRKWIKRYSKRFKRLYW